MRDFHHCHTQAPQPAHRRRDPARPGGHSPQGRLRRLPLAAKGTLDLSNVNGSITIEAWDRPEVEVRADKTVKSPSEDEANKTLDQLKVIVDAKPNRVKVEAQFPHSHSGLFSWLSGRAVESIKVEFHVRIPREADLRIENVNGGVSCDLEVAGTKKRNRIEGTLNGGGPEIEIDTVNGSVNIVEQGGK